MTVESTANRVEYVGNGVTVAFGTAPVVFFNTSDLKVYLVVTATNVAALQTITTHYTVSGGAGETGTVTMVTPPASTTTLVIVRTLPLTQVVDFVNNDPSDAEVAEDTLDKLTMITQQLEAQTGLAIHLSDSDLSGANTVLPAPEASMLIGWNSAGTALANYTSLPVSGVTLTAFAQTLLDDATALEARATLGQNIQILWGGLSSGSADAQTLAPTPVAETLVAGTVILFKANFTNTAATTIMIGAQAATAVQNRGLALAAGQIVQNQWYLIQYDGAAFQLLEVGCKPVRNPGESIIVDSSQPDKLRYANVNRGVISGLIQAVSTTTSNTFSVGVAMDSTNVDLLELTASIVKTTSAWVVGTGNGGLDTGTIAGSTWYYAWLIKRTDTGVVDVMYSVQPVTPTMPTNYTLKRRIGAFITDGASLFVAYTALETAGGGLTVLWTTPTLDIDLVATLTTSRRTDLVKTPSSIATMALLNVSTFDSSSHRVWVYCPSQADLAPSGTAAPLATHQGAAAVNIFSNITVRTSASGQIAARADLATVDNYRVSTLGFEWSRT